LAFTIFLFGNDRVHENMIQFCIGYSDCDCVKYGNKPTFADWCNNSSWYLCTQRGYIIDTNACIGISKRENLGAMFETL